MVDTNALVAASLVLISNFCRTVPVSQAMVPTSDSEIARVRVGNASDPAALSLFTSAGAIFQMSGGAIDRYTGADCFYAPPSGNRAPVTAGKLRLTKEEAAKVIRTFLATLLHTNSVSGNASERIWQEGSKPFYLCDWKSDNQREKASAFMELDGRSGSITSISLYGRPFHDTNLHAKILAKTYRPPQSPPRRISLNAHLSAPSTNYVLEAIPRWIGFCRRLGLDPGTQTNVDEIDWQNCRLIPHVPVDPLGTNAWRISFKNGVRFYSTDSIPYEHVAADAYFAGDYMSKSKAEKQKAQGLAKLDWRVLSDSLTDRISSGFNIPKSQLSRLHPESVLSVPAPNEKGLIRALIHWTSEAPAPGRAIINLRYAIAAEFDLRDGSVKLLSFSDSEMLHAIQGRVTH